MSPLDLVFQYWPAIGAGILGALVPRGDASTKQRAGLAFIAALTTLFVIWLWPTEGAAQAAQAPGEWPHLLNLLIALPIVGAAAVLFIPRQMLSVLRGFTYVVLGIGFVASLWLLTVPMTAGWHFQYIKDWMPFLGIRYHVAIDGISLWLVLLTTFVTPIAAYASFGSIKTRIKEFCFALLLLQGGMIGAFVALDLFLFYVFWELMLVPMFMMIGVWGGADRVKAAIKFFLYTMAGSVLMLAAIIYLVWTHQKLTGDFTFDYLALSRVVLPKSAQLICFWAFSLAFFIKVPMWPVHTWLPDAHVQAPTGGSVILAAVMLKLGTYAYMRFSMGLFPGPASNLSANLAGVAILGGILYGALVAWKQRDVKRLVAYSSVAHLGFVMLGLFSATPTGMQGAVLQMVNHGVSTGALFLLVGVIYDRRHTREVDEFGGLAKVMPLYTVVFLIVTFASVGVPGTNGFVGEFLVIMGTFLSERLGKFAGIHTVGAAAGVILAAVYMLYVVQKMFFGPLTNPKNKHLPDLTVRESLALAPLVLMIFVIGFFPAIFLDRMKESILLHHNQYKVVSGQAILFADERDAKLLPEDTFSPAFLKGMPKKEKPEEPAAGAEGSQAALGGEGKVAQ
ncbi:complex I subunit 4 family protein [Polyangium jinanense]|uniref:NADH-quinone oxidoreductase subunit M n=1 Tax=Polyangium jinanense TaxID=2829994 RepID=A0A9X4AXZ9_9BACT|nr:NADH-quinone oxidoreductase subunit M [Polyangium jinanense]MDC3957160.1 NADH-quinone oxidoreductase subunit M [Polyangium jinanense]MDC3986810.1 NADH-quinone oxidoreductase subunit M [Polyangium jinanense]